jgi:uncharacterized phage protein (TIGR01671 family)
MSKKLDRFYFRGYCEGDKKLSDTFHLKDCGVSSDVGEFDIYLQCTGLRDIHDKLIFEGDILKIHWKRKKIRIFEIFFHEGRYKLGEHLINYTGNYDCKIVNYHSSHCINPEIIGNRFINPELLYNDNN